MKMQSISKKTGEMKQTAGRRVLNQAEKRATAQRMLLLELIRRGGGHLDAEELHQRARKRQPRLSLSTVYRTLQLFKHLGLVEEHHFDESHHHYEMRSQAEHHHLVCLGCGKVIEFQCPLTVQMKQDVAGKNDFEVLGTEVRMVGLCSDCQSKEG